MLHIAALLSAIAVLFVQQPDGAALQTLQRAAIADLGTVSGAESSIAGVQVVHGIRSYKVTTTIGLRATSDGTQQPITLQAYLDDVLSGITVRLDGVQLGTMPQIFADNVPLGTVTRHRLEIDIPNVMPSTQLPSDIQLEVGAVQE
jgi:hypothetical protein